VEGNGGVGVSEEKKNDFFNVVFKIINMFELLIKLILKLILKLITFYKNIIFYSGHNLDNFLH